MHNREGGLVTTCRCNVTDDRHVEDNCIDSQGSVSSRHCSLGPSSMRPAYSIVLFRSAGGRARPAALRRMSTSAPAGAAYWPPTGAPDGLLAPEWRPLIDAGHPERHRQPPPPPPAGHLGAPAHAPAPAPAGGCRCRAAPVAPVAPADQASLVPPAPAVTPPPLSQLPSDD